MSIMFYDEEDWDSECMWVEASSPLGFYNTV